MSLIRMSLQASLLVIVILSIRKITFGRIRRKTFLIFWWIVIFRMLVPCFVSSRWSIYNLGTYLFNRTVVAEITYKGHIPSIDGAITVAGIWQAGMICTLILFAVRTFLSYASLRYSVKIDNNPIIDCWKVSYNLLRPLNILTSDCISAPFTIGLFKPCIFLPSKMSLDDDGMLKYVLTHEYFHIYRCDIICKFFAIVAVCVHWFNPFAWVMLVYLNHDIELACDELVMYHYGLNSADKKQYALSLLSFASTAGNTFDFRNFFGRNALEERVMLVLRMKKQSAITRPLTPVLIICIILLFATSGNSKATIAEETKVEMFGNEALPGITIFDVSDERKTDSADPKLEELRKIHNIIRNSNLRSEEYRREKLSKLIEIRNKGE